MDLRPLKQLLPEKFLRYHEVLRLHQELGFGARRLSKICGLPIATIHNYIKGRTKPYKAIPSLLLEDELEGPLADAFLIHLASWLSDATKTKRYTVTTILSSFSLAFPLYLAYLGIENVSIRIATLQYRHNGQLKKTDEVEVCILSDVINKLCKRIYWEPEILLTSLTEEELIKLTRFAFAFDGSVEYHKKRRQIILDFFEKPHVLWFFKDVLSRFGVDSRIVPTSRQNPKLVISRRGDIERFYDIFNIFGWKGIKLQDCLNIHGKRPFPEHYIFRGPLGHVPPEVAMMYDALKAPINKEEKLWLLTILYSQYYSRLFTKRDLEDFKHLILPIEAMSFRLKNNAVNTTNRR